MQQFNSNSIKPRKQTNTEKQKLSETPTPESRDSATRNGFPTLRNNIASTTTQENSNSCFMWIAKILKSPFFVAILCIVTAIAIYEFLVQPLDFIYFLFLCLFFFWLFENVKTKQKGKINTGNCTFVTKNASSK